VWVLASVFGILMVSPLNRLRDGAERVAGGDLEVCVPITARGEIGYLTDVFNTMVVRLRDTHRELERLSATDPLTGLYNRRRLMELLALEARRSRRHKRPFTVLMIDVDYFKQFNDTYGHMAGDEVLKRVAGVLTSAMRAHDHAARYGGEEFMVVMAETDLETGITAAQRVRELLAAEALGPEGRPVTASIGVAEYSMVDESVDGVIAAADRALYDAKEQGRDRIAAAPRDHHEVERPYLLLASNS
jgi:diguanylate cyclase (GGDEF)-like protein